MSVSLGVTDVLYFVFSTDILTQRGSEPLKALLRELGGWPVVNDGVYDEGTWELEEVLAASRIQLDRNFLFHNRISVDAADSNAHILTVYGGEKRLIYWTLCIKENLKSW